MHALIGCCRSAEKFRENLGDLLAFVYAGFQDSEKKVGATPSPSLSAAAAAC
jgi:hypothetical protein